MTVKKCDDGLEKIIRRLFGGFLDDMFNQQGSVKLLREIFHTSVTTALVFFPVEGFPDAAGFCCFFDAMFAKLCA